MTDLTQLVGEVIELPIDLKRFAQKLVIDDYRRNNSSCVDHGSDEYFMLLGDSPTTSFGEHSYALKRDYSS